MTGPEITTQRLRLRPWHVQEAPVLRELWLERDPRTPPGRRVDAAGRPTVADLTASIKDPEGRMAGLLALERLVEGDVIGWCGLVDSGRGAPGEPEMAFELLHRAQGQGYGYEAAVAVVEDARASGHRRLWATVWDWNLPSRRLLARLGFVETGRTAIDPQRGTTLWTVLVL